MGGFGIQLELKRKPIPKAFMELRLPLPISYSINAAIIGITTAANPRIRKKKFEDRARFWARLRGWEFIILFTG